MARPKVEALVTQSLLDRLTGSSEWPTTRSASLRMFREGIKRDVEWLLNARKPHLALEGLPLASASVLNFGLPDLLQFSAARDPESLLMAILSTVRTHEPRIRKPHVTLTKSDPLARSLRFHVEGRLQLEAGEEDISFDTVLEVTSGEYEVK